MVLILALLAMLIIAVVVYAGFFLVFKLGWIIAGKKRNKWPLIFSEPELLKDSRTGTCRLNCKRCD